MSDTDALALLEDLLAKAQGLPVYDPEDHVPGADLVDQVTEAVHTLRLLVIAAKLKENGFSIELGPDDTWEVTAPGPTPFKLRFGDLASVKAWIAWEGL